MFLMYMMSILSTHFIPMFYLDLSGFNKINKCNNVLFFLNFVIRLTIKLKRAKSEKKSAKSSCSHIKHMILSPT